MKNFRWDKKYLHGGVTAFLVVVASIMFFMLLQYWPSIRNALSVLIGIVRPFIIGFALAYLLYPIVNRFQRQFFALLTARITRFDDRRQLNLARVLSVVTAWLLVALIIYFLLRMALPQVYQSIISIGGNINTYAAQVMTWARELLKNMPEVEEYLVSTIGSASQGLTSWLMDSVLPQMNNLITSLSSGIAGIFKTVINIFVGIVVSIYVLYNKEKFSAHAKMALYGIFSQERVEAFIRALRFTDRAFSGFIIGKLIDSLIIGVLCYICCWALKMPYVMLISVIIGVTNIIPFFGPFIGAIPCAVIVLMESPVKCLIFVIFIIILQQVDGNIIGPKILGSSVGINGFWIMFAIIIGGGLFGFLGMICGVPVFTVIYAGIRFLILSSLKKRDMPTDTLSYTAPPPEPNSGGSRGEEQ